MKNHVSSPSEIVQTLATHIQGPLLELTTELQQMLDATTDVATTLRLKHLVDQSTRVQKSINDSLEIARSTSDDPSVRSVDFRLLARDLAESQAHFFADTIGLSFSILVDPLLPDSVTADPRRLLHLIGNIVENGVAYLERGSIVLSIQPGHPGISTSDAADIVITCRTAPQADEWYRPASSSAAATTNETRGLLGLSWRASQAIAASYGGDLELEVGGPFERTIRARLRFPVERPAGPSPSPSPVFGCLTSSSELFSAVTTSATFHKLQVRALSAADLAGTPDTILVDGADLCRGAIGPIECFPGRDRCVVVLAHHATQMREQLVDAGFSRFLNYPFPSTALVECLADNDSRLVQRPRVQLGADAPTKRVLVVDDAATSRLCVGSLLRNAGYAVTEASDGLEMVSLVESGEMFDLILTDLTMTYLDGEPAMRQVHTYEAPRGRKTPIVAMTAYGTNDNMDALRTSGFAAVLRKPIYIDELDFIISLVSDSWDMEEYRPRKIDIDDLKTRTSGKPKLMSTILDSFIQSAGMHLNHFASLDTSADKATSLRMVHTLRGLLLEVGAAEAAQHLLEVEKRASIAPSFPPDCAGLVCEIVTEARDEAVLVRDQLTDTPVPRSGSPV